MNPFEFEMSPIRLPGHRFSLGKLLVIDETFHEVEMKKEHTTLYRLPENTNIYNTQSQVLPQPESNKVQKK